MRVEFPGAYYHVMSRGRPRRPRQRGGRAFRSFEKGTAELQRALERLEKHA